MPEPTNLMRKLADRLFPDDEAKQNTFLEALFPETVTKRTAVIWNNLSMQEETDLTLLEDDSVPDWLPETISILSPDSISAGKSKHFDHGDIYPMDVSSIYTASAMLAVPLAETILDVCAAPGGKSLFAHSLFSPDYLLSNEVIGKRLGILRHNLKKSALSNIYTQSLDPAELSDLGKEVFDLVIVDAPCSGQSLLAKGTENLGCFHPNIVKGNAKRQLRILSQSAECVAPGGFLFYSTCTFAPRENEGVIEKFLKRTDIPFREIDIPHLAEHRSTIESKTGYRFYPHIISGAGGYCCLLKRDDKKMSTQNPIPDEFLKYPVE